MASAVFPTLQISPPHESIVVNNPWRPWWERYQPISYNLCSRSGTENELRDMITRCNNVGVTRKTSHIMILLLHSFSLSACIKIKIQASTIYKWLWGIDSIGCAGRCTSMWTRSSTTCVVLEVDRVLIPAVEPTSMPARRTSPLFLTATRTLMTTSVKLVVEKLRTMVILTR